MLHEIKNVFKSLNYIITEEEYLSSLIFFSDDRQEIRNLIEKLSWEETDENQKNAIEELVVKLFPCEYIYLVLPDRYIVSNDSDGVKYYKQGTGKTRWENAAKTIIKLGWPKIDNIVVPLFIWLLDPNWPGSSIIYELIGSLPKNVFIEKSNIILDNPQNYSACDYNDLKALIAEMLEDISIDTE